jgi:hypothetical protein
LYTVRSIEGHGFLMTRYPPAPAGTGSPSLSTTSGSTPKNGSVPDPGLVGVTPGSGLIMIAPVSVCHQVSTMGQRLPPITVRYHIQASGLIGSPTVPSSRSDVRSCFSGHCSPQRTKARMAVGAV